MENRQRRDFIRKSLLGISGAALVPGALKASRRSDGQENVIPELPGRTLGRTGIKTPLISLGAAGIYDPNFVKAAYHAGVKLFFSATYYGEGKNEIVVGEGLKGIPRDSFVIGTATPADEFDARAGVFKSPLDIDAYIRKAEASLKRFGLDYVDIFLFPYAGKKESLMHEPLLRAMQKLKETGKTRFIGIATHGDCAEALTAAADSRIYDVAMTAYNFKTQDKTAMNNAISYAAKSGMGVIAMKTTAGAARDKSGTSPLNTDAALKWALQHHDIATVVSGMTSLEQLEKNLAMIGNLKMTEQEMKDINLALNNSPGLYCHQCRQCVPQCPHGLEIPAAMRSYMYAYGYRNMGQARFTLTEADLDGDKCNLCDECTVKCTAGFNIRERILDISRLKNVPGEFLV
jgi:predicted aldo/keto reductase-like oxidoreductase